MDDPPAGRIVALCKRLNLGRRTFADHFGLDAPAVQDRGQGRQVSDRTAPVLPTAINSDPDAIMGDLTSAEE